MEDRRWKIFRTFAVFEILDIVTTWYAIAYGNFSEGNLFFRLFHGSWPQMLAFKVLTFLIVAIVVSFERDRYKAELSASVAALVMMAVVIWNSFNIWVW